MKPLVINGELWWVIRVPPESPALIDRTGSLRLATTDGANRIIFVSRAVVPPLLDRVMLHEIEHAVTMAYGMLDPLRLVLPRETWVYAEEWSAGLLEAHAIEAIELACEALGRPVCIEGSCLCRARHLSAPG